MVGALASFGVGLMNNAMSQENAQAQRDWQERMWKLQNAYNHPAAMADRMRAAGLNPYQMMGAEPAGSVGTGAAAETIPLSSPLDALKTFSEIENLNAATNRTVTETEKIMRDVYMLDLALERGLIEFDDYQRRLKKYWDVYSDKSEYDLQREASEANIANTNADTALKQSQMDVNQSQVGLIVQQIAESEQRITSMINSDKREDRRLGVQEFLANLEQIKTSAEVRLMRTEEERNQFYNKCILPIQRQIENLRKQNLVSEKQYKDAQAAAIDLETKIKQGDAQGFMTYFNHYLGQCVSAARVAVDAFL